jgi:hypothetical protein
VLGLVWGANDWSVGLFTLVMAAFFALAVWVVHYWPGDSSRRR